MEVGRVELTDRPFSPFPVIKEPLEVAARERRQAWDSYFIAAMELERSRSGSIDSARLLADEMLRVRDARWKFGVESES